MIKKLLNLDILFFNLKIFLDRLNFIKIIWIVELIVDFEFCKFIICVYF